MIIIKNPKQIDVDNAYMILQDKVVVQGNKYQKNNSLGHPSNSTVSEISYLILDA